MSDAKADDISETKRMKLNYVAFPLLNTLHAIVLKGNYTNK